MYLLYQKASIMAESPSLQDNDTLKDQLLAILKGQAAVGEDSIEETECAMQSSCVRCQGKGYLLSAEAAYIKADMCSCIRECVGCQGMCYRQSPGSKRTQPCASPLPSRVAALYNASTLPARFLSSDLTTFRNFTGNGEMVLKQLTTYLSSFPPLTKPFASLSSTAYKGLVLSGDVGVGKTFLLISLAKILIQRGYLVKFIDFFQLISEIKAGFNKNTSEDLLLAPLMDVDILLIDELGKGRNSEFEHTILDQIVMGRYNQGKPLISTTNYVTSPNFQDRKPHITDLRQAAPHNFSLDHFGSLKQRVGKRIFSRLQESCVFMELSGKDYRDIQHATSPFYSNTV
ncbi:MAG: ATP-binding protein [Proteobacteria bacterium]|nr:ATP-binding protein [Pseudomonadota bacterium]